MIWDIARKETMDNKFINASLKEKNLVRVSNLEKRLKKECEISNFRARHVHVIGPEPWERGLPPGVR